MKIPPKHSWKLSYLQVPQFSVKIFPSFQVCLIQVFPLLHLFVPLTKAKSYHLFLPLQSSLPVHFFPNKSNTQDFTSSTDHSKKRKGSARIVEKMQKFTSETFILTRYKLVVPFIRRALQCSRRRVLAGTFHLVLRRR